MTAAKDLEGTKDNNVRPWRGVCHLPYRQIYDFFYNIKLNEIELVARPEVEQAQQKEECDSHETSQNSKNADEGSANLKWRE